MKLLYYILFITYLNFYLSSTALAIDGKKSITPVATTKGFIENKGQIHNQDYKANTDIKYLLSTGRGMNVQLLTNSFSYDTYWVEEKTKSSIIMQTSDPKNTILDEENTYHFHRVDIELIGANLNPKIEALYSSQEYFSYHNAVTLEKGATNVHHYEKVIYKNIYPNIDLEFETNPKSENLPFKYNFIVHTGGNIADIKLHYKGANKTQLQNGNINIVVAHTSFIERIPLSYEEESGKEIKVSYLQIAKNQYGFQSEQYNTKQTLVIDPTPERIWGTYYGNNNSYSDDEAIQGSVLDNNGKLYVVGKTRSLSAIATTGAYQATMAGEGDGFLSCFNTSTGVLIWGTYYGGETGDALGSVVLDNLGNIYVQGETFSTTGIATSATHQPAINATVPRVHNTDTFLARFNSQGIREWATYFGKNGYDHRAGLAIDNSGSVYTLMNSKINNHNYDAIIASFNTSTGILNWQTSYGGDDYEYTLFSSRGITLDNLGKLYITGRTRSTTGIATNGVHQETLAGKEDAFVAKFDTSTGALDWGTYFGGNENDISNAITVDNFGKLYITGRTLSNTAIATLGTHQNTLEGNSDAFVAKFNTSTGVLNWSTYFGGENDEMGLDIVSKDKNVYICGTTNSATNIATSDTYQDIYKTYGGNRNDAFLLRMNDLGAILWSTYYGGIGHEGYSLSLAVSNNNEIYLSGNTESSTNIATSNSYQETKNGYEDAFIVKFRDIVLCEATATTTLTFPAYQLKEVINTSAQTLSDNWLLSKHIQLLKTDGNHIDNLYTRPYTVGKQGIWRGESSFAYVTDRKQSSTINLSEDGTYTLNMFNWKYLGELDCPEWRKVETVSEYHPQSSDVERYNILKLYSSFHIGYSNQLVSAAAANSKQYEFGFEGFEEYTTGIESANANLVFSTYEERRVISVPYWFTLETGRNRRIWAPLELQTLQNQYSFTKLHVLGKQIDVNYPGEFRSHTTLDEITIEGDKSLIKFAQNEISPFEGFWTGKVSVTINKTTAQLFNGGQPKLVDGIAHTGTKSLKIDLPASFDQPYLLLIPNKKYVVSAWVRVDDANNPIRVPSYKDLASIQVEFEDGQIVEFSPQGQIIEGWQRIEGSFIVPENGMGRWNINLINNKGLATYFDDIRLFPSLCNMESFVYDTETFRLEAKLDANNYATFYYYDAEGRLYLVKQETAKGVQTLQTVTTHTKRN